MNFTPPIIALVLSILLTWFLVKVGRHHGWLETPKADRWHKRPAAKFGGVALFFSFSIALLMIHQFSNTVIFLFTGGLFIFALGITDDVGSVRPSVKFVAQVALAISAYFIGFKFLASSPAYISLPLTVFWIVGIINAFNLLDNMDGLSSGIAIIACAVLAGQAFLYDVSLVLQVSMIMIGSCLGFLIFNFNPAKIFMGDGGSMFIGFVLSVLCLSATDSSAPNIAVALFLPVAVLAIPIFDTSLVTVSRILNKKPITAGGKDHSSHRLVQLGLSERRAVVLLYIVSAIMGSSVLVLQRMHVQFWLSIVSLLVLSIFLLGIFLSTIKVYSDESSIFPSRKLERSNTFVWDVIWDSFLMSSKQIFEIVIDVIVIIIAYSLSYYLRFENGMTSALWDAYAKTLPAVLLIKLLIFNLFKLYKGVWRYMGIPDILNIFKANILGSATLMVYVVIVYRFEGFSRSVFVIDFVLTFILVSSFRLFFRLFSEFISSESSKVGKKNVLLIGAGDAGNLTLREIRNNDRYNYNVVGFIDDNPNKKGLSILDVPILGGQEAMEEVIGKRKIDEIIISIFSATDDELQKIFSNCERLKIPYGRVVLDMEKRVAVS